MKSRDLPFYTIIIPHYNAPHKLRRLLKSIPLRDDLQVLVVDDSSSNYITEYEAVKQEFSYIEFYSTEINGGGGKARNIGLKHAAGSYVIFADSDDYFTPEFSLVLDRYSRANDADIIFCNAVSVYEDSKERSTRTDHLRRYLDIFKIDTQKGELLLRYGFGEPWSKIIKRSMLMEHQIMFDELPIHNDTKFSYLIGTYARHIMCDSVSIYCVTDSPKSVSKAVNWKHLKIRAQVFAKKEQYLRNIKVTYSDPMAYTPLFIALLNFKIGMLKELIDIYSSCGFNCINLILRSISATMYYITHRFDRISKYHGLR